MRVSAINPLSEPPVSPINDFNLFNGAITSGFVDAPGYSPTRPNVGPETIPPSANATPLANTALTPAAATIAAAPAAAAANG